LFPEQTPKDNLGKRIVFWGLEGTYRDGYPATVRHQGANTLQKRVSFSTFLMSVPSLPWQTFGFKYQMVQKRRFPHRFESQYTVI
jgi:hypothetical protein